MLFNSLEFIFAFLPIVFIVYFILNKIRLLTASKFWLIFCSLFFYSWWNVAYLPLILISMLTNFTIGTTLSKENININRKVILILGITFNVGLLGYFKYSDFFIGNVNYILTANLPLLELVLPLAISFFTFQQIAYLIDAYRLETKQYSLINYALFVTFFPQLIAGPIVHHKEMMPQFASVWNKVINYRNIALGIFIFSIGLFKKVIIADTFAVWANEGFDHTEKLSLLEAWIVSLSYTFQLYFDFSGYTDMAIGAALLFNIVLPMNFNSPYKALNIIDFWSRWHITLTRFLTKYVYIPLGGNRKGSRRTYINIMLIFLISGLWHGAGWTFVFWGFLHGLASISCRYWKTFNFKMNKVLAWFITFNFVNVAWVFFRAETWSDAIKVLQGMAGFNGVTLPGFSSLSMLENFGFNTGALFIDLGEFIKVVPFILIGFVIVLICKNSIELKEQFKPNFLVMYSLTFLITSTLIYMLYFTVETEFLYFNF